MLRVKLPSYSAEKRAFDRAIKKLGVLSRKKSLIDIKKMLADRGVVEDALASPQFYSDAFEKARELSYLDEIYRHEDLTTSLKLESWHPIERNMKKAFTDDEYREFEKLPQQEKLILASVIFELEEEYYRADPAIDVMGDDDECTGSKMLQDTKRPITKQNALHGIFGEILPLVNRYTYDHLVGELQAILDKNTNANQVLNKAAQVVLDEVKKKYKFCNDSIHELNDVLKQTIKLLKTPMFQQDGDGSVANQEFTNLANRYSTTADQYKKCGIKKVIAGAMVALLGVAMIVGCAMLMASTFGAAAAIGIPMLITATFVPHFTAGMAISTLLGAGLGLFGVKAISRGASDIKLANAMNKLTRS